MEEDTVMQGGEESEYPDPTDDERTPYPSIPPTTSPVDPTTSPWRPNSSVGKARALSSLSSNANTNQTYTSLSDYFSLGSSSVIPNRSNSIADSEPQTPDRSAPRELNGHPWTDDFFNRLADAGNMDASASADGRGNGKRRGPGRPRSARPEPPRRRRGWRWALRGTEHADLFAKPKNPRGAGTKKRGRRPGRPKTSVNSTGENWIDPGAEFGALQGKANQAWLEGDNETALEYAKKAVQVNSEVFMAHKMIHDILQAQGDERGAVVALGVGANTKRDANLWAEVADRLLALDDRNADDEEWARTCYVEAIKIDIDCYQARAGKFKLAEEAQDWDSARLESKAIARRWPEDLEHVYKYAELCKMETSTYEWERAKEAYERAFEWYANEDMLGQDEDEQWTHLNVYLDILIKLGHLEQAISQLKRLSRWFLGRKGDVFWDDVVDDREFDTTNERRIHLWQFQQGRVSRDNSMYGEGLPIELRIKLGLLRIRTGMKDEALRHFEHLKGMTSEAESYEDVFREVAECLKSYALYSEALEFYEPVKALEIEGSQIFWIGMAQCYNAVGRSDDAEKCYLAAAEMDEYNVEARVQLARLYNVTGRLEKASKMAEEVTHLGRYSRNHNSKRLPPLLPRANGAMVDGQSQARRPSSVSGQEQSHGSHVESLSREAPAVEEIESSPTGDPESRSKETGQTQHGHQGHSSVQENTEAQDGSSVQRQPFPFEAFHSKYERVQSHYTAMMKFSASNNNADVKKWIQHAAAFEDMFRRTGKLYAPFDSLSSTGVGLVMSYLPQMLINEMQTIKRRAGRVTETQDPADITPSIDMSTFKDFHGIPFAECHRIFSELALAYARDVEQAKCYDTLQNGLMKPVVFRLDQEFWNTTQAVRMCCALTFNDSKLLTEIAQEYVSRGNKRSGMAMQLFAATGRLSHGEAHFYDSRTTQWLSKIIDVHDAANSSSQREIDPGLLTVRGSMAANLQHHNARPALPYLLRALALQPENLVVNLSLAATYMSNAMRKDAADRQNLIAAGQAFFDRYYELRIADGKASHLQEAHYNFARLNHQLGLMYLAVPAYEKVLKLSGDVRTEHAEIEGEDETEVEDFAQEAAFALQGIFVAKGDDTVAKAITEKWLEL